MGSILRIFPHGYVNVLPVGYELSGVGRSEDESAESNRQLAYEQWKILPQQGDSDETSKKYWQDLEQSQLIAAETPQKKKTKAKACLTLLHETAARFSALGGDAIVAGACTEPRIPLKVWGFGKTADVVLDDLLRAGISLQVHFEGREHVHTLPKRAIALAQILKEVPDQTPGAVTVSEDPKVLVKRNKMLQMKEMLTNISNLSNTPVFTAKGHMTKNFWQTHLIENWPSNLPNFTSRALSDWTVQQCNQALDCSATVKATWTIVPTDRIYGSTNPADLPTESLLPLYEDDRSDTSAQRQLPQSESHLEVRRAPSSSPPNSGDFLNEFEEPQEEEYIVEKILDDRVRARKKEYRVKWLGYSQTDWQPAENLVDQNGTVNDKLLAYLSTAKKRTRPWK